MKYHSLFSLFVIGDDQEYHNNNNIALPSAESKVTSPPKVCLGRITTPNRSTVRDTTDNIPFTETRKNNPINNDISRNSNQLILTNFNSPSEFTSWVYSNKDNEVSGNNNPALQKRILIHQDASPPSSSLTSLTKLPQECPSENQKKYTIDDLLFGEYEKDNIGSSVNQLEKNSQKNPLIYSPSLYRHLSPPQNPEKRSDNDRNGNSYNV